MKKNRYFFIILLMLHLVLAGCMVEIDSIDMTVKTSLGVTIPVGEIIVYNDNFVPPPVPNGTLVFYDTIENINLSKIDFQSASDSKYVDTMSLSDIFLFLNTTNELPVDIQFEYTCYDDYMTKMPIHFFNNLIKIKPATYRGSKIIPSEQLDTVHISSEQLQLIKRMGTLIYKCTAKAEAETLEKLEPSQIKVHIGLCANVNANLDFAP